MRRLLISAGVVAVVFIAAAITLTIRPTSYSAEAEIAVVPLDTDDQRPVEAADTIGRGTIVDTYALVLGTDQTRDAATARLEPPVDASDVEVTSTPVAGTSIVRIQAVADDEQLAEQVADAIAEFDPDLGGFSAAFGTQVVESAEGNGEIAGASPILLYAGALLAALVIGALVYVALGRLPAIGERPGGKAPRKPPERMPDEPARSSRGESGVPTSMR